MEYNEIIKNSYYHDNTGMLLKGDCLDIMKNFPNKSINLVIVDFPYNIGTAYKTNLSWDNGLSHEKYIDWCGSVFLETQRVLKDNGSFYWFHNNFETLCDLQQWIKNNTNFNFMQFITWNKRFENGKKKSYLDGYIVEDRLKNYYKMAEYIMFYTFKNFWKIKEVRKKRGIKQISISSEILSRNGNLTGWFSNIETGKYFPTDETIKPITKYLGLKMEDLVHTFNNQKIHHSVWDYDISEKSIHPTQKPVALIENIILHSSNENEIVLDNAAGSCTTAIACKNTNRRWICIEQEEKYCDISVERIKNHIK